MVSSLINRLEDIPGVASVVVDLEGFGRGIDVRLEPGADEIEVMDQMHALLAAYGVRSDRRPEVSVKARPLPVPGVKVQIAPTGAGARIEVATKSVKSFRVVAATPMSVAQGLADAWCQVVGRIPVEIVDVVVDDNGVLVITASDGESEVRGEGHVAEGWRIALTKAVAALIGERTKAEETAVSF